MKNKIIISLSALVVGLSAYLFYDSTNGDMSEAEIKTEFMNLKSDYELLQVDLENNMKDLAISNNTILMQKSQIETILKKNAISEEELLVAKQLMSEISQNVMKEYNKRIEHLQKDKAALNLQTEKDAEKQKTLLAQIKTLEKDKKNLNQQIEREKLNSLKKDNLIKYASKLSISNFILKGVKVRRSGKEVQTDKASRIDKLEVSFDINENLLAETGEKELYLVVHLPDKTLATFSNKASGTFLLNGEQKVYSEKLMINYINGTNVTVTTQWENDDFQRGNYVLEVYEKTPSGIKNIGKATKALE
ncbi:hypothetical protein BPO_0392 [Bergeyella porcorum]|uniref:Chromosome partitioning protein ParA n=1 Tax=Bergeyella porcorum TaxID=1735111 RepID=A0AAU0F048_9FLAO